MGRGCDHCLEKKIMVVSCWCCCERDTDKVYCQLLVKILGEEASTVGDGGQTLNEGDYFGLLSPRKVTGLVCLFLFFIFLKKFFWVYRVWGGIRENVFCAFLLLLLWGSFYLLLFLECSDYLQYSQPFHFLAFSKDSLYFLDLCRMFSYLLDLFRVSFLIS